MIAHNVYTVTKHNNDREEDDDDIDDKEIVYWEQDAPCGCCTTSRQQLSLVRLAYHRVTRLPTQLTTYNWLSQYTSK